MTATSKRSFLKTAAIAVLAGSMLASCSTLIGPRDVHLSLAKMQQGLERRFPIDKRVLSVLDVKLTHPQLSLQPERERVALSVDASVDRVSIEGMDESQQRQFAKVASLVADQLMHETPIYTFKPEDLHYAGVQFVPTRLRTTADGLVVTVEPVK